jgi:hypothetical protein
MRKFLLALAFGIILAGPVAAATVTLNWTAAAPVAPNPTDVTGYQVWVLPPPVGTPPLSSNTQLAQVAPNVTAFTTGTLAAGPYQFTVVAVYGEGSAAPSNTATATITTTVLAPATNLTATVNP